MSLAHDSRLDRQHEATATSYRDRLSLGTNKEHTEGHTEVNPTVSFGRVTDHSLNIARVRTLISRALAPTCKYHDQFFLFLWLVKVVDRVSMAKSKRKFLRSKSFLTSVLHSKCR